MQEPRHRFWHVRPVKSNTRSNSFQRTFLRIWQVNYDDGENLSLNFTLTVFWINLLAPYVRILDQNCRRARDWTQRQVEKERVENAVIWEVWNDISFVYRGGEKGTIHTLLVYGQHFVQSVPFLWAVSISLPKFYCCILSQFICLNCFLNCSPISLRCENTLWSLHNSVTDGLAFGS